MSTSTKYRLALEMRTTQAAFPTVPRLRCLAQSKLDSDSPVSFGAHPQFALLSFTKLNITKGANITVVNHPRSATITKIDLNFCRFTPKNCAGSD